MKRQVRQKVMGPKNAQANLHSENSLAQKRVFVGMSGGVDSSVSAALLQKAGFDVTGVFIKVWQPDWLECTWREDRRDAMRVAAHLGIPFVTLDLEKEYKKEVVDYMISEYKAGRTPNPDVMCNRYVKFGGFYDWAMKNGADFVATGHYAQIVERKNKNDGSSIHYTMEMSADKNKDQTYFLWTLKREQLPHILFPIGHLTKPMVRKLAKRFGLPTAEKRDSQGLCFIGKIDFKEFLKKYISSKPGKVLDEKGEIIGTHSGAAFLTIGERHGFKVYRKTPNDKALYIVAKNIKENTVTVGHKNVEQNLSKVGPRTKPWTSSVQIKDVNWIGDIPGEGSRLSARSRYRQPLENIKISAISSEDDAKASVTFEKTPDYLAPGQSLVIYEGEKCLGGGIII